MLKDKNINATDLKRLTHHKNMVAWQFHLNLLDQIKENFQLK